MCAECRYTVRRKKEKEEERKRSTRNRNRGTGKKWKTVALTWCCSPTLLVFQSFLRCRSSLACKRRLSSLFKTWTYPAPPHFHIQQTSYKYVKRSESEKRTQTQKQKQKEEKEGQGIFLRKTQIVSEGISETEKARQKATTAKTPRKRNTRERQGKWKTQIYIHVRFR